MTLDLVAAVDAGDHTRGVSGGRQVVVYGDFECPYTAPTMREIGRLLEGGAAFEVVFRHFPLRSIHPHAQASAEAAEAAARQGRFWEMHDLLFRNQARLERDDLQRYAERIGLDRRASIRTSSSRRSPLASNGTSRAVPAAASTGRPACSSMAFGIAVPVIWPA